MKHNFVIVSGKCLNKHAEGITEGHGYAGEFFFVVELTYIVCVFWLFTIEQ